MAIDLKEIHKQTREALGEDVDLSHITEEMVEEARANAQAVPSSSGRDDGNTFMRDGNRWKWRKNCSSNPRDWLYWSGNARATRKVNCANGLLHYDIDWW
jgi:hypothetical protein